jgi:hypothetical protein
MYELIHFDNPSENETYGRDAFGEFGTILATDSELAIPELSDFQSDPDPQLHNSQSQPAKPPPKQRDARYTSNERS